MKQTVLWCAFFSALLCAAAARAETGAVPDLKPRLSKIKDLGPKAVKDYEEQARLVKKLDQGFPKESLSARETALLNKYGWEDASIWDTVEMGCSWYCGGGPSTITASSELRASGGTGYAALNAHDFSFRTAWVEGAPGYGAGEHLDYTFENKSPRVTAVLIYDGYVKSEKSWAENSRVKLLKLYANGALYARLHLADTRDLQRFDLPGPLGRRPDGKDLELKFEIADVYKGGLYKDTALTEVYFDGLDVHCLAKGTMIAGVAGAKRIETLAPGDEVLAAAPGTKSVRAARVKKVIKAVHDGMILLRMDNGLELTVTADHPLWVEGKGWAAYEPAVGAARYAAGDKFLFYDPKLGLKAVGLKDVRALAGRTETYTLQLGPGEGFIGNGLVVGAEECREAPVKRPKGAAVRF